MAGSAADGSWMSERAADASYVLAMWSARQGDRDQARVLMQRAVQLRPDWRAAQDRLRELSPK